MWINVKDKKPEKMISALVIGANGKMLPQLAVFYPDGGYWRWSNVNISESIFLDVSHYMEIPPPPKKEEA